jgi:hypothetical protein
MNLRLLAGLALTAATLAGCASRYELATEAPNYAGVADIEVRVNKTELREMTLQIDHLAPPRRIDPTLSTYIVWIAVPGHATAKLGKLEYDEKDRAGSLVATSAYPKFEVLVTLESDPSTSTPSSRVVLRKLVGKG